MRAGTPTLKQCQWLKRKFCGQGARTKIDTIHQLRSWASNRHIPTEHNMLRDGTMYVVPVCNEDYPDTDGVVLVSKIGIGWLLQKSIAGTQCA